MNQIDRENHAIRMAGGTGGRMEISDAARERNAVSSFGQLRAGELGIGSANGGGRVSEIRLAAAAEALSRFSDFKIRLNGDGSMWEASVAAVYGRESSYRDAKCEAIDMREAVIGLFEAMSAPWTYVSFREVAALRKGGGSAAHYAMWEGEGYHDKGWLIRARDEVQASGDELAEDGPWSRLRPPFMKLGYVHPGPPAVPRPFVPEAGSEADGWEDGEDVPEGH